MRQRGPPMTEPRLRPERLPSEIIFHPENLSRFTQAPQEGFKTISPISWGPGIMPLFVVDDEATYTPAIVVIVAGGPAHLYYLHAVSGSDYRSSQCEHFPPRNPHEELFSPNTTVTVVISNNQIKGYKATVNGVTCLDIIHLRQDELLGWVPPSTDEIRLVVMNQECYPRNIGNEVRPAMIFRREDICAGGQVRYLYLKAVGLAPLYRASVPRLDEDPVPYLDDEDPVPRLIQGPIYRDSLPPCDQAPVLPLVQAPVPSSLPVIDLTLDLDVDLPPALIQPRDDECSICTNECDLFLGAFDCRFHMFCDNCICLYEDSSPENFRCPFCRAEPILKKQRVGEVEE